MVRLKRDQRRMLADKLPDFGNVAAAALAFGQAFAERRFSVRLASVGVLLWLVMIGLSVAFAGDREEPR